MRNNPDSVNTDCGDFPSRQSHSLSEYSWQIHSHWEDSAVYVLLLAEYSSEIINLLLCLYSRVTQRGQKIYRSSGLLCPGGR